MDGHCERRGLVYLAMSVNNDLVGVFVQVYIFGTRIHRIDIPWNARALLLS